MTHQLPVRTQARTRTRTGTRTRTRARTGVELTHRAFGGDGHRLQEDLDDPGSDPRRVLAVCVQVVQDLLDHVVRVLRLLP